jgi:hypothetical protein
MKDLISEIQTMRNRMGLNTTPKILSEAPIPTPLWNKLAKYFDELIRGGEKSFDDLAKKGVITNEELIWLKKNASEIARKAKTITDPNTVSDLVLKKFKNIVTKISKDEIEKLSKVAFNTWLEKNPKILVPIDALTNKISKLIEEFSSTGKIQNDSELTEYLNNGGTWEGLFKSTLESEGYKDDLLDFALEKFRKDAKIKLSKTKPLNIENIIEDKINNLLNDPTYKDLNSLEKLKKINTLKKELIDELKLKQQDKTLSAKISEKEIEKLVDDKLESLSGTIETFYTKKGVTDFLLSVKGVGNLLDEFISLGQLFNSTAEKNITTLKNDISDIIVLIDRSDLTENYYREVANKIKALSSNARKTKESVTKFWDDLKKLITEAFPNDPKKAQDIINKIGGPNKLDEFFTKTNQYVEVGDRIKETWQKILDAFGKFKSLNKEVGDMSSNVLKFGEGPAKRWANFIASGSFTSFKEWTQRLAQRRKFLFVGKEVQGFSWKSYFDMYCRVWFVTNLAVPMVTSFLSAVGLWFLTAVGKLTGIGNETKYFTENKNKSIGELWGEFYSDSIKSSLIPFIDDYNGKMEGSFPQTIDQWGKWAADFVGAIIPFNTKIDDIVDFIFNTPEYLSKAEKIKNEQVKKGEETLEKVSDKLKGRDKVFVEKNNEEISKTDNIKKVEEYKFNFLDILNNRYYIMINDPSKIGESPSENESIRLLKKIGYDGEPGTYDESKFYVLIGGKKYKIYDNTYYIDPATNQKKTWETLGKRLYEHKTNNMEDLIKKIILEEEEERTLKMKDWDEIFTFQKMDEKNPGKYSEVKLKMDSVMDRMPHWRKKYKKECEGMDNCDDDGEDDSFVRAVIDTHPEVVRILFTKGLAHLTSSEEQEDLNEGLHKLLAVIREAKSVEVEVWSVYRHPSSPDKIWSLVKGDYKPKELASMDVKIQQSPQNTVEPKKNSLDELKKKESQAIKTLSIDEKKGLTELPIKVKNIIKEKIKRGWTTEIPSDKLINFYKKSEVDSVLVNPIDIYKLKPTKEFFDFLIDHKIDDSIKRGFCRSIYYVKKEIDLSEKREEKINDILDKCQNKFDGKYGQNYI